MTAYELKVWTGFYTVLLGCQTTDEYGKPLTPEEVADEALIEWRKRRDAKT